MSGMVKGLKKSSGNYYAEMSTTFITFLVNSKVTQNTNRFALPLVILFIQVYCIMFLKIFETQE